MTARTLAPKLALLLSLALPIAACGSGEDQAAQPGAGASDDVAATAPRPAVPFPDAALVLNADGIGVEGKPTLGFGTPRAAVDAHAAAALAMAGTPSRNAECGAGPLDVTSYGPLQLLYQDGRFAGWVLGEADPAAGAAAPRIVTVDGIAPGTTMAALGAQRQVRPITDSTLEGEFQYLSATGGMIGGFYRGDQRDGTVTMLNSGLNCFFR